jgi:hypothetical protein
MRFEWDEEKRRPISQSTALILFAPRGFSTEGPGSTLSLARRSVSLWTGAQDFKHWRTGRRNDRGGLDAAGRRYLQDHFGEAGER